MRPRHFLSAVVLIVAMAALSYATSPGEQLHELVGQLQKNPADKALREKIIKLAREIIPAPALPEEAERRMVRGEAAFESAKGVSGYEDAIREFQASANAAPWYPNAYFNLGTAQEKANKPRDAMESFRFYLLAAPDGKDAADMKKRIYKLEYAAEQAAKVAAVEAEKERKRRESESALNELRRKVEGATYSRKSCETGYIGGDDGRFYGSAQKAFKAGNSSAKSVGCNWSEYSGSNWYGAGAGAVERFDFSEAGTVRMVFIDSFPSPSSVGIIGTPDGPSVSSIKWECPILEWEGSKPRIIGKKPAWVNLREDGSSIIYTCDTNSPASNPTAKYNYWWFKRN